MLFVDDIVLIDELCSGVNDKLKVWRAPMESKGFGLSKTKIEHLECKFGNVRHEVEVEVKINTLVIYPRENCKYLKSTI